jgi:hypothetical protein
MDDTAHMLATTTDVDAARATIAGLSGPQLRAVANQLGIHLYGTVARQRKALLYWGVERRLDAAAIRG